jgi:2-oxo-3-hexenedioate decarboxylase/2-keto-4-pentenoate hydratase
MTDAAAAEAARLLVEARLSGRPIGPLPEACRPRDEDAAYRVQAAAHGLLTAAGKGALAGWKIGCTTPVMQRFLDIPSPCAGGMLAGTVFRGAAALSHASLIKPAVECEIAVRLGADLPAGPEPWTRDSVAPSVAACMAAIELVDDRYADYRSLGTPTLIADDFFHVGCVLAPEVADWRRLDLPSLLGETRINGAGVGEGRGADVMGHPFAALAWLANRLAAQGRLLRAGQIVLTGSVVETRWVQPGDRVEIVIEGLGEARARFD